MYQKFFLTVLESSITQSGPFRLHMQARPKRRMRRFSAAWLCAGLVLAGSNGGLTQSFTVLHTFPYSSPPGGYDRLLWADNMLYGLAASTSGYGSIFRINASGTGYSTLKTFPPTASNSSGAQTNSDGAGPLAGVILDGDTLYGTAQSGGLYGLGTIFSLKTNGLDFTVIKQFSGTPDGKLPYAELLMVSNVLYGTTAAGGDFGRGTVFQVNTDGSSFNVLKSFDGTNDGLLPLGGLTCSGGVLYGTTYEGGASNKGTVFSISPDGSDFATLKEFNGSDGANPRFNLVVSGNWIYGTTEAGGSQGQGLVYGLSTDGTAYNILKTFSSPDPVEGTNDDGCFVESGLAVSGGTLFGSTRAGGYYGSGVLFAVRMDGSGYTVLRHFTAAPSNNSGTFTNSDGAEPGPVTLSGGILYGTPEAGGAAGSGTLFALNIAPQIELTGGGSGVGQGGFGFNIVGYSNQVVVVESSAVLAPAAWQPISTNTVGAVPLPFIDSASANYPQRFYRLEAQ